MFPAAASVEPAPLAFDSCRLWYLEAMTALGRSPQVAHDILPLGSMGSGPGIDQMAEHMGDFVGYGLFQKIIRLMPGNRQVVADQWQPTSLPADLASGFAAQIAEHPDPGCGPSQTTQPGRGLGQAMLGGLDQTLFQGHCRRFRGLCVQYRAGTEYQATGCLRPADRPFAVRP